MSAVYQGALFSCVLFFGIMAMIWAGRRYGRWRHALEGEAATKGVGAVEGAIFGLLGLVLAFSFSGALSRFDDRRKLVVEEVNDIGTAWLRIDELPEERQGEMRALFRHYLDARIEVYRDLADEAAARAALGRATDLQGEIWKLAVPASHQAGARPSAPMLFLPALNAMFDITTTRTEASRWHPPLTIYMMLGALTLACSLLAGYDMGARERMNVLHTAAFALVLAVTVYVIVDLEYPRLGLIQVKASDQALIDLRRGMD